MDNQIIDICVITYNRLEYLKNCVWSILASTGIKYRLIVIDDNSSDGTSEWLNHMKDLGKIDDVIINEKNIGSPNTINKAVRFSKSNLIAIISDDIWVHRGWDISCIDVFKKYEDCGMVSFWNYPVSKNHLKVTNSLYKIQSIGVAALMLNRELFDLVGGYELPSDLKMGYFSKIFCKKAEKLNFKRKNQYLLINPYYAEQMDRNNPGSQNPPPKLNQEHLYSAYNKRRKDEKLKHKSLNL
jgi:cellulose synthase/poly-beta-1,6-N-acetylglucosamine synthase-like glycosyltransferase